MQSDSQSVANSAAAHAQIAQPNFTSPNRVMLDDPRITGWVLASNGGLGTASLFDGLVTTDGYVLRARILANNTLEVTRSTVAAASITTTLAWSANTLPTTITATYKHGVALFNNAGVIDLFWVDATTTPLSPVVYQKRSSDNGKAGTWGTTHSVTGGLSTQYGTGAPAPINLVAPAANLVFYTTTSSFASHAVLLNYFKTTDAWVTPVAGGAWDYDALVMGIDSPVSLFGSDNASSTMACAALPNGDLIFCFYSANPRSYTTAGLWTLRAYLTATNTFSFGQIESLLTGVNVGTVLPSENANPSGYLVIAPRLQTVGSDLWITATEVTQFAGNFNAILCALRAKTTSGTIHFTDRMGLGSLGVSTVTNYTSGVLSPLFTLNDILYNKMLVAGNNLFMLSYDRVFVAGATSLCGVSNPAKTVDLSGDMTQGEYQRTPVKQISTATIHLRNRGEKYTVNQASLIDGARVILKAGYGSNLTTLGTMVIDEAKTLTKFGRTTFDHQIELTLHDYLDKLVHYISDYYYQYASGLKISLNSFKDLTALAVFNGNFTAQNGTLYPAIVNAADKWYDNLAYVNSQRRVTDGWIELPFKIDNAVIDANNVNAYIGIAFQGVDAQNYYAVTWNRGTNNQFQLVQATPAATTSIQYLTYTRITTSNEQTVAFKMNGTYAMRVRQYHNKVWAEWASGINSPENFSSAPAVSGSLGVHTFYYTITAIDALTNEESGPSAELAVTTNTTNQKNVLTWNKVPNAAGKTYKIYRSLVSGAANYPATSLLATVNDPTVTYTDDGTVALTSGSPPVKPITRTRTWNAALSYTGVPTNAAYWGILMTGQLANTTPIGYSINNQATPYQKMMFLNDRNTASGYQGKRDELAARIPIPGPGVMRGLDLYFYINANQSQVPSIPEISINVVLDKGDGTQPADLTVPSNILYSTTVSPSALAASYINFQTSTISLQAYSVIALTGGYVWIWVHPANDIAVASAGLVAQPAGWLYDAVGANKGGVLSKWIYQQPHDVTGANPTWTISNFDTAPSFYCQLYYAQQSVGFTILGLNFASGEPEYTMEHVIAELATKAEMNGITAKSWVSDALSTYSTGTDNTQGFTFANNSVGSISASGGYLTVAGADSTHYGVVRTNAYLGTVGEFPLEIDLVIQGATNKQGIAFRLTGNPNDSTLAGYYVEFQPSGGSIDKITLYQVVAGNMTKYKLGESTCLAPLPINQVAHVMLTEYENYITVYVNGILSAMISDGSVANAGYVGLVSYGTTASKWANLRIPEIRPHRDTYTLEGDKDGRQNLDQLIGLDQIYYSAKQDGSLFITIYASRDLDAAVYSITLKDAGHIYSGRYRVSDLNAQGNYFARYLVSTVLALRGRFYKRYSTNAYTDSAAYLNAQIPARDGQESSEQYPAGFKRANPALEVEDEVITTNAFDGVVNGTWIVTDYAIRIIPKSAEQSMTMNLRKFIS